MTRDIIATQTAPQAIGAYSQAVTAGGVLYISGQIPLDPQTQALVSGGTEAQIRQVFANLSAIARAADTSLDNAIKVTIYLTDLDDYAAVNALMAEYFCEPFPARAAVGVAGLPKNVRVEADAIVALD